jgi:hypothetical protein
MLASIIALFFIIYILSILQCLINGKLIIGHCCWVVVGGGCFLTPPLPFVLWCLSCWVVVGGGCFLTHTLSRFFTPPPSFFALAALVPLVPMLARFCFCCYTHCVSLSFRRRCVHSQFWFGAFWLPCLVCVGGCVLWTLPLPCWSLFLFFFCIYIPSLASPYLPPTHPQTNELS